MQAVTSDPAGAYSKKKGKRERGTDVGVRILFSTAFITRQPHQFTRFYAVVRVCVNRETNEEGTWREGYDRKAHGNTRGGCDCLEIYSSSVAAWVNECRFAALRNVGYR